MNRKWITLVCLAVVCAITAQPLIAGGGPPPEKPSQGSMSEIKGDTLAASEGWELIDHGALIIDVRSAEEFEGGHIDGSLNIPHSEIDALADAIGPDKDRSVVFYCRSGGRAGRAQKQLEEMGFTGIFNATGYEAMMATRP